MSVELPFAPVDTLIHAGDLRVKADAAEELARAASSGRGRHWQRTPPNARPRTAERH